MQACWICFVYANETKSYCYT